MRIVLDAMGGDHAPEVPIAGAVEAARALGVEIVLVGQESVLRTELAKHSQTDASLSIVHAPDVIAMNEHAAMAVRQKRESSIVVGMRLVRDGRADAFVSAGHSGAVMAAATLILGRVPGVQRPTLASLFPQRRGHFLFTDIGAITDCRPEYLVQFAVMGTVYAEKVYGVDNPRVALLANGEEETKGDRLVQEAYALLRQTAGINFIGNVEPKEMLSGAADVVVADGFVGNVVLKTSEAVADMLLSIVREELTRSPWTKALAAALRPAFRRVKTRLDYREYGGAPLLGLKGVAIIAHGRSDDRAIYNAIRVAHEAVAQRTVAAVAEALSASQPSASTDAG